MFIRMVTTKVMKERFNSHTGVAAKNRFTGQLY